MQQISLHPMTNNAIKLFNDSILTLSEIESIGIKIDTTYLENIYKELTDRINELKTKIMNDPYVKEWKSIYGKKFKISSNQQLAHLLFERIGEEPIEVTEKGNPVCDKHVLEKLSHKYEFLKNILEYRKLTKARDTYLKNIKIETINGYLYPVFNLHTVTTFRSSSSDPNFQNIPIRDPEIGRMIRRCFIPRDKDFMFGGVDYGSMEVRIAACYHKDPVMLDYLEGKGDLHRDVASDCFITPPDNVSKSVRKVAKNKFTFPQFYGDYYVNCARGLWEDAVITGLKLENGLRVKTHLKKNGIKNLDEFTEHIREVEDEFWNRKFKVYKKWKEKWVHSYYENGYIDMYTGFRCKGVMSKNDVINYPVQGAAFHCLLWSMIRIHKWLKRNKLQTKVVGQIHDEIVMDLHKDEKDYVLEKVKQVMAEDIRKSWKWIIVNLEVEAEFCQPGESWADKKEIEF